MFEILELFIHAAILWPAILGAFFGVALAYLLSLVFPGLPPALWFFLAFLGATVGLVWRLAVLSARESVTGQQGQRISAPMAFLGIAIVGGISGSLIAAAAGVPVALLCLLVAPSLLGKLYYYFADQRFRVRPVWFASLAAVAGFSTFHAIAFALGTLGT